MSVFDGQSTPELDVRVAALEAALAALTTQVGANANTASLALDEETDLRASGDAALSATLAAETAARIAGDQANFDLLADNIADITVIAGNLTGANTIGAVAAIADSVVTVGTIAAQVSTVAGLDTEIGALYADRAKITAVHGALATIGAVNSSLANVNAVAAALATIGAVNDALATIGTVNASLAAINGVNASLAAIGAVNAALANVNAVAGALGTIGTINASLANINTVGGAIGNVNLVAGAIGNVNLTAGSIANVNLVAGNMTAVQAIAANIGAVLSAPVAAATAGVYANAAATYVPQGAAAFSLTNAGSGGTNSTNNLATFSGGTLTYNPVIYYDVVGGAVTNVRMTFPGLYIGTGTPTMPTVALPAGAGGAALTLTAGKLFASGAGYWVVRADGTAIDRYYSNAGTPAIDASVGAIYLGKQIDTLIAAPASKNLFPDPFWLDTTIAGGFRGANTQSPFTLGGAWTGFIPATAASPWPRGNILVRPKTNVTLPVINLDLMRLGLAFGDTFELAVEAAFLGATSAVSGSYLVGQFKKRDGTNVGSTFNIVVPTAGNPLTATFKQFASGAQTVPAGATALSLTASAWGASQDWGIASVQLAKTAVLPKPTQHERLPGDVDRIRDLERYHPGSLKNNVLMRRTTYTSATDVSPAATSVLHTAAAFGGYGGSYQASIVPVGGFNMLMNQHSWAVGSNAPTRIYAIVRTSATGTNPLVDGATIAWGWIDVDPTSGGVAGQGIELFAWDGSENPSTPKTVLPADCSDLIGIAYIYVKADGGRALNCWVTYGTVTGADPALVGYRIDSTGAAGGGLSSTWNTSGASNSFVPKMYLAAGLDTRHRTPSAALAAGIASYLEETPDLAAMPAVIWNTTDMETWLIYAGLQHRTPRRTNFKVTYTFAGSHPANPSGMYEEGVCIKETGAGTKTLTVEASIGSNLYASKSTQVVTVAKTAGAGLTRRVLGLGSSLMQNAGLQTNMLAVCADANLNPGSPGLTIQNVGTVGSSPNQTEGRSGMSIGIYFSPGDKFYNGGTFDFGNYVATYLAGVAPHWVILGDPFWSVGSATTDAAAATAAASTIGLIEQMITSIAAYNTANAGTNGFSVKTMVWFPPMQPEFGQDGEPRTLSSISQHQRNRNLREAAKAYAAAFPRSREASYVYALPLNAVCDPETAVSRYEWAPRNPEVSARISTTTYANYAAMVAAAGAITDNTIVLAGTEYWVKCGAGSTGGFRAVTERDGFIPRIIDSTHGVAYRQAALQAVACIKCNL